VTRYRALVDLQNANDKEKADSDKNKATQLPVINRLNAYPPGGVDITNLVTYPPKLQPVPVKPLFLDLAWNYIEYPGDSVGSTTLAIRSQAKDTTQTEEDKKPAKKGWFGFGR
jgi:signal recognition particle subunit SRP68